MVIDGKVVITGSFDSTRQEEKNLENLFVIREKALAERYPASYPGR